jgi:hypothetical protein
MNGLDLMNLSCYYVEIGQYWLGALGGQAGMELPLERQADGRLTGACRERVTQRLRAFLKKRPWQPRVRVVCALGARGVALRRLTLPASTREEVPRLLSLQIESEFPLPPDELAWGYGRFGHAQPVSSGPNGKQEFLVAAVKRKALEDYLDIFTACGASPVFTLAALARSHVCPHAPATYAVLDLGQRSSELAFFEDGLPTAVRVLPWGGQDLVQATVKAAGSGTPASAGPAAETALDCLARSLDGQLAARKIYVTGAIAWRPDIASQLSAALGNGADCEAVKLTAGEGRSAALLGLRQAIEQDGGWPSLILKTKAANGSARVAQPTPLRWAVLAAVLALAALAAPYAEALLLKSRLAAKLAAIKQEKGRLGTVDRELEFLHYLKQDQPAYLDVLFIMAKAAPPGTRFDTLSMNRRGELSVRGSIKDSQQLADFRSKLLATGCFTNVVVEEQTPTPDRQKLTLRMSAQWDAARGREGLASTVASSEADKSKAAGKEMLPAAAPNAARSSSPATTNLPHRVESAPSSLVPPPSSP